MLTFEALAIRCYQPLLSPTRLRLFGGHSARVTGARALAASGLDIDEVSIFSRHSGDTILRYLGDAPLDTVTSELAASSTKAAINVPARPLDATQLSRFADLLAKQTPRLEALYNLVRRAPGKVFVLNLQTNIMHAARSGEVVHTACG